MATISRRRFHLFCLASVVSADGLARRLAAAGRRERAFTLDLRGSSIGVHVNQSEAVELAFRHGFESLTPSPTELAELTAAQRTALLERMQACRLVWGSAGLPVEFRRDQSTFDSGLRELPRLAKALEAAGVTRMGTYLRPYHDQLSYHSNFRQHTERLRACAKILHDHGLRFGLEYVGPKTLWASSRHSFIHTMAETRELITAINVPNMGLVLDSWHWYTSHETADDLRSLTNRDIVACDLNDAPRGPAIDEQIDNRRELPMATGVIDLAAFLNSLNEIGYDGPVRAEPFNATLNQMDNDAACEATAQALRAAFNLVRQ